VELNLSAYEATKHALLLARLVRDLKGHFNDQFEVLRAERKEQVQKFSSLEGRGEIFDIEDDVDVEDVIQVFLF